MAATRTKTLEYWFPTLLTAADASDTNFTQITAYIPEFNASTVFRAVWLEVQAHDRATTVNNTTRRQLSLSVGGSAYTAVNNTNTLTNSGEQLCFGMSADFTALFLSAWTTGTSKTINARVLFDSAMTSATGYGNITARLVITYDYDDTVTTHAKTVWIPMNAYVAASPTSKPGTANAGQIPNLSTYCPESSKTFRQITVVVQGNTAQSAAVTDVTLNVQAGTLGAFASTAYEGAAQSDMWFRVAYQPASFSYSTAYDLFIWGSLARFSHPQVWIVVTYEYDTTGSTDFLVSVQIPAYIGHAGGATVDDYAFAEVFHTMTHDAGVTPVMKSDCAVFLYWGQSAAVSGLNVAINWLGSFTAYTDAAAVLCGSNGLMQRMTSGFNVEKGYKGLIASVQVYRTDTADLVSGLSAMFMLNYTTPKPTTGYASLPHMLMWPVHLHGTGAAAQTKTQAGLDMQPYEAQVGNGTYLSENAGLYLMLTKNSTGVFKGVNVQAGVDMRYWVLDAAFDSDDEVGVYTFFQRISTHEIERCPVVPWYGEWPSSNGAQSDWSQTDEFHVNAPVNGSSLWAHSEVWYTLSNVVRTITGTLTGFVTSEGTTVQAFVADRYLVGGITGDGVDTTGAGPFTFSFDWFADDAVYVQAWQQADGRGGHSGYPKVISA